MEKERSMACSRLLALALCLASIPIAAQAPVAPSADGTTPLHTAVRSNDLAAVQRLLRAGSNPGAANRYGVTPLSLAAETGSSEIFAALLKAGADPKALLP